MVDIPGKYAGECIAIIDEQIVASGKKELEVYSKAKMLYPGRLISLMRVPRKNEVITFL